MLLGEYHREARKGMKGREDKCIPERSTTTILVLFQAPSLLTTDKDSLK